MPLYNAILFNVLMNRNRPCWLQTGRVYLLRNCVRKREG